MKNAMKYKYNLTNAEAGKKWLLINRSVNGTGRTIKFKINLCFTNWFTRNEIDST